MADPVLAVDCSTTACKAVVWDMAGRAAAQARETFSQAAPHPGRGEQDPLDWWTATAAAIGRACRQIDTTPLAAMAITQ